eukprot:gene31843-7049_t
MLMAFQQLLVLIVSAAALASFGLASLSIPPNGVGKPVSDYYYAIKTSKGYYCTLQHIDATGSKELLVACNSKYPEYINQFTLVITDSGTPPAVTGWPMLLVSRTTGICNSGNHTGWGSGVGAAQAGKASKGSANGAAPRKHKQAETMSALQAEVVSKGNRHQHAPTKQQQTDGTARQAVTGSTSAPTRQQRIDRRTGQAVAGSTSAPTRQQRTDSTMGQAVAGSSHARDKEVDNSQLPGGGQRILSQSAGDRRRAASASTQHVFWGPLTGIHAGPTGEQEQEADSDKNEDDHNEYSHSGDDEGGSHDEHIHGGGDGYHDKTVFAEDDGNGQGPDDGDGGDFRYPLSDDIDTDVVLCRLDTDQPVEYYLYKSVDGVAGELIDFDTDWLYLREENKYCTIATEGSAKNVLVCNLDDPTNAVKFSFQAIDYPFTTLTSVYTGGPCGIKGFPNEYPHDVECASEGADLSPSRAYTFSLISQTAPMQGLTSGSVVAIFSFIPGIVGFPLQQCCVLTSAPYVMLCMVPSTPPLPRECWFVVHSLAQTKGAPVQDGDRVFLQNKYYSRYCSTSTDGTILCYDSYPTNISRHWFTLGMNKSTHILEIGG